MSGVKVTFTVKLLPEAVDGFCGALPEMIKDTAKRPGFRDICIVRHATELGTVMFIETWDSEQSYHASATCPARRRCRRMGRGWTRMRIIRSGRCLLLQTIPLDSTRW